MGGQGAAHPPSRDGDFSPSRSSPGIATVVVMTFLGADTVQLRGTAQNITDGAHRLEEMLAVLAPLVHGAAWTGPDADAFRDRFDDAQRRGSQTTQTLAGRGEGLKQEADEQDDASGEDGGAGFPDSAGSPCTPGAESNQGGMPDWFETIFNTMRSQGIDRFGEYMKESPWGRGIMKSLPVIGAIPEVAELIEHAREGDVGGGISDIGSIALGFVPGGGVLNVVDGVSPAFMPQGKSLMDWAGEIESNGFVVQGAEMTGAAVSASLGFEQGGTADTVTRSSAAIGAYVLNATNPVLGVANSLHGAWNTFR